MSEEHGSRLDEIAARLKAGKLEQGIHYREDIQYLLDMLKTFQGDIERLQSEGAIQVRAFLAIKTLHEIHEMLDQAGFCPRPMA